MINHCYWFKNYDDFNSIAWLDTVLLMPKKYIVFCAAQILFYIKLKFLYIDDEEEGMDADVDVYTIFKQ